jgi:cytochrome c-type biogenesis protein CcmH
MGRIEQAETARRDRPSQASAEADVPQMPANGASEDFLALMDRLRAAVESRPDDLQGHRLLARNEARLGNFVAAYEAQEQVIRIKGDAASAADYADYGDLLVLAAGGYVSPEAERAFQAALARDPANGAARYYTGLMFYQTGRPDRAFRIWREQLRQSSATAPWVSPIRAQIEDAARRAGIEYSLPPVASGSAAPGPSAADIDAAGEMTPSERMEMIEGMVSGLSERLATEGGPPEEWARLIRALGVLGRTDRAAAIWGEAQQVFPDEATRLPILRAARDAGVAQ